jgi:hypothetical protein
MHDYGAYGLCSMMPCRALAELAADGSDAGLDVDDAAATGSLPAAPPRADARG